MMHSGKECGREIWDLGGKCLWHSPNSEKDPSIFQSEITAMLDRKDYDFTSFVFTVPMSFAGAHFEGPTSFEFACFRRGADFQGATFEGVAYLAQVVFDWESVFYRTVFQNSVHFTQASYHRSADFRQVHFEGMADFGDASFMSEVDFRGSEFQGEADHSASVGNRRFELLHSVRQLLVYDVQIFRPVTNMAQFSRATFQKEVRFVVTDFRAAANFVQTAFEDVARFQGERVSTLSLDDDASPPRVKDSRVFSQQAETVLKLATFSQPEKVSDLTPFRVTGRTQQAVWDSLEGFDLRPRLGEIQVPTLVVAGAHDRSVTTERAREAADALPQASLLVMKKSGHYPFVEEGAAFASGVLDFLKAKSKRKGLFGRRSS